MKTSQGRGHSTNIHRDLLTELEKGKREKGGGGKGEEMTCPLDDAGCRVPTIVRRWFSRSSCSGVKRVRGEDGRVEGGEAGRMSIQY